MRRGLKAVALVMAVLLANKGYAEERALEWLLSLQRMKEVKPVTSKQYQEECGSCHFAYQPGLLPTRSWDKLLDAEALRSHFGENAELDKATLQALRDYTLENAADKSYYKRSRKIALATAGGIAPLRITEVSYIKRQHQNIPQKMVGGNPDVKSLSYCDKCHTQAAQGVFDDDTVEIPNHPGWKD